MAMTSSFPPRRRAAAKPSRLWAAIVRQVGRCPLLLGGDCGKGRKTVKSAFQRSISVPSTGKSILV